MSEAETRAELIDPKLKAAAFPITMSGYGVKNAPFKGVHDDLFARVIVFSDGANKAVLITADVTGFSNSFWEETINCHSGYDMLRMEKHKFINRNFN
jgi:hypothetical protein